MQHPTPNSFSDLYSAYAAGCLDPAFALMVEAQSALRPDISRSVALSEMISSNFLEGAKVAELSEDALDRALAAIDAIGAPAETERAAGKAAGDAVNELLALTEPVRSAALDAAGRRGWSRLSKGLKRMPLDISTGMEVELYRIEPGVKIPRHSHGGAEYTLVLAGGFSDERGSYGPGDISVNGPEHTHQPVADEDGVCFALSVRDGGLRFKGALGLLQKVFGAR